MTASPDYKRDFALPPKFRLMTKLGQGGMAQVYLALASGPNGFHKLVVLKILRPEFGDDVRFVEMFFEEAKLAAKLNHGNIVQTYEVGGEGQTPYISMEYLDGQPLSAVIQRITYEKLPLGMFLLILQDMLTALHYAHEFQDLDGTYLNLVHRDVSPQNIIVTYDGQVKLVDFGIAKAVGSSSHTQTGVIKGKLRYIAPEQILTNKADRRADVFAAGIMLWEALAQQGLYKGETEASILHKRATGAEPWVLEINPSAPRAIAATCAKAMALNPDERYATALDFQQALERAIEQSGFQISRRELSQLISTTFADQRSAIRETIEKNGKQAKADFLREISAGDQEPTQAILKQDMSSHPVTIATLSSATRGGSAGESTEMAIVSTFFNATSPRPWLRRAWLAASTTVVFSLVGVYVVKRQRSELEKSRHKPDTLVAASASPPAKDSDTHAEIKFHLTVVPPEALVTLDDVMIPSNRYQANMPYDGGVHRLRITSRGYETEERLLRFDNDVLLSISLQRSEVQKTVERPVIGHPTEKKPTNAGAAQPM